MAKRGTNQIDLLIGKKLRFCRQNAKMSQERVGEALGITFQQIQKYELGTNRVSASRLHEMANLFGVPISFFFDGLHVAPYIDLPPADEDIVGQALEKIRGRTRRDLAFKLVLAVLKEFEDS